jgi:hypothetical protein
MMNTKTAIGSYWYEDFKVKIWLVIYFLFFSCTLHAGARLRPSDALSYVKFEKLQKFGSRNIYLLFRRKGTLKSKQ